MKQPQRAKPGLSATSDAEAPDPQETPRPAATADPSLMTIGTVPDPLTMAVPATTLRRLGPYEFLSQLGEGGMGTVYRARHTKLDKIVAVKVLSQQSRHDPSALARFTREMKAVGKLDHPNIVRALDAGDIEGVSYIAMEFIEGADLKRLVEERGPLSVANACKAIRQAAQALSAAHRAGLIHRDIKPANLLLTKAGQVKLLDLGLALLAEDAEAHTQLTRHGDTFGTPDYMAPEQWENSHTADARTDLYAIGCTLYFLLTGRSPYSGEAYRTVVQKMKAHLHDPIPDVRTLRAEVPEAVATLCRQLMAKNPEARPQTADDLRTALKAYESDPAGAESIVAQSQPIKLTASLPRLPKSRNNDSGNKSPKATRHAGSGNQRIWGIAGGIGGLVVMAVLVGWFLRPPTSPWSEASSNAAAVPGPAVSPPTESPVAATPIAAVSGAAAINTAEKPTATPPRPSPVISDSEVYRLVGHNGPITTMQFSADSRTLYSAGSVPLSPGELRVWDVASRQEKFLRVAHSQKIMDLDVSDDGSVLVTTGGNAEVIQWNTTTMKPIKEWSGNGAAPFDCLDLGYHLKFGPVLVTSSQKGSAVTLWNADTGQMIRDFTGHSSRVGAVMFSSNAEYIVTADIEKLRILSTETGGLAAEFPGRRYAVFTPKSLVIAASPDNSLHMWKIGKTDSVRTFEGHTDKLHSVSLSRDGSLLFTCGYDKTARVWDVETGTELRIFRNETWCTDRGAISPDGAWIAYGGGRDQSTPNKDPIGDYEIRLCRIKAD